MLRSLAFTLAALVSFPTVAVDRGDENSDVEPTAEEILGVLEAQSELGKVDANGWVAAESTLLSLNVALPCQYTEMKLKPTSAFMNFDTKGQLSCTESNGIGFTVQRTRIGARQPNAPTMFGFQREAGRAQADGKEATARFNSFTYQGREAFDLAVGGEGFCTLTRTLLDGDDLIVMKILGEEGGCDQISRLGPHFLNSLQLPPVPAPSAPPAATK